MRNLLRYSLFVLLLALGCDTERIIFHGPYFVRFTDDNVTYKESHSSVVGVEIHVGGPAPTEDLVIAYEISGDARNGIDYKIVGDEERVTIKKGTYFGSIQVQLIDNANNILRSQDIIFTLRTVSSGSYQIGQDQSGIGTTFTFTIQDDCILGGDFIGKQGASSTAETIVSTDCINYTLSNWNINVFSTGDIMPLNFVDNGDNTITIPNQVESNLPSNQATINGTGVVDPVTRQIILTVVLVDFTGQPQVTITLIPN